MKGSDILKLIQNFLAYLKTYIMFSVRFWNWTPAFSFMLYQKLCNFHQATNEIQRTSALNLFLLYETEKLSV